LIRVLYNNAMPESLQPLKHHFAMQESWLIAVLSIQTLLFCSVLVFRKNISYLTGVFVIASKW